MNATIQIPLNVRFCRETLAGKVIREWKEIAFTAYARGSTEETNSGAHHFIHERVTAETKETARDIARLRFSNRFGYYPEILEVTEEIP